MVALEEETGFAVDTYGEQLTFIRSRIFEGVADLIFENIFKYSPRF